MSGVINVFWRRKVLAVHSGIRIRVYSGDGHVVFWLIEMYLKIMENPVWKQAC